MFTYFTRRNGLVILVTAMLLAGISRTVWCEEAKTPASQATRVPDPQADLKEMADAVADAKITEWKPAFVGIDLCEGSATHPRPLQVRAARVDLKEKSIRFLVTPSNGKQPMDCDARWPTEFLSEFKCQLAVNASFFGPLAKKKRDPQDVTGLSISNGDKYSPSNKSMSAMLISKDNKVWFSAPPIDTKGAYNAAAGSHILLKDGKLAIAADNFNRLVRSQHPRTLVGTSQDGRYLYLVTIDGRQAGYSEGVTMIEAAGWLAKLGAYNALNLDGGGSTTMVIEGADGKPQILNKPCGGIQRHVANCIGVFAKPLPTKASATAHGQKK